MTRAKAVICLMGCVLLWSTGGVLIKSVDWSPLAVAGGRSGFCALFLWLFYRPLKFQWHGPQIGAALTNAATMILFVCATKLTTSANAIFLQYTAPVYVALFSGWYLREKITWIDWTSLGVALFGMYLFFQERMDGAHVLGAVLACMSAITFAWFTLFMRKHETGSRIESIILANALAFLACSYWTVSEMGVDRDLFWIVLTAAFQLAIPGILYSIAIQHMKAFDVITISLLEPIMNPVWVFLAYRETPSVYAVLGGACILSVVFFRSLEKKTGRITVSESVESFP